MGGDWRRLPWVLAWKASNREPCKKVVGMAGDGRGEHQAKRAAPCRAGGRGCKIIQVRTHPLSTTLSAWTVGSVEHKLLGEETSPTIKGSRYTYNLPFDFTSSVGGKANYQQLPTLLWPKEAREVLWRKLFFKGLRVGGIDQDPPLQACFVLSLQDGGTSQVCCWGASLFPVF